jgi:hypothetical protein
MKHETRKHIAALARNAREFKRACDRIIKRFTKIARDFKDVSKMLRKLREGSRGSR